MPVFICSLLILFLASCDSHQEEAQPSAIERVSTAEYVGDGVRIRLSQDLDNHLWETQTAWLYQICYSDEIPKDVAEDAARAWNGMIRMGLAVESLKRFPERMPVVTPGHWNTHYSDRDKWLSVTHGVGAIPRREIVVVASQWLQAKKKNCMIIRGDKLTGE